MQIKLVSYPIEPFQTGQRARDPHALFWIPILRDPWAVIPYFEDQSAIFALGADFDRAWCGTRRDTVTDGVFDQRLKNQVRRAGVQGLRRNAHPDFQPVRKTHALDFEIAV